MGNAASLGIAVYPTAVSFGPNLQKQIIGPATEAGARTGKSFSEAFTAEAAKAGVGVDASIANTARASQLAIQQASANVVAARAREEDAVGRVSVAEKKLAETRAKYAADSSQVAAAEQRLASAQRSTGVAAESAQVAEDRLTAIRRAESTAAYEAATAQDAVAASTGRVKTLFADQSKTVAGLMSQYGKLGALIGVAVVADMGVKGVKAAADFQQSQERLVTTAGELQVNLSGVSQGILDMAGQVGISAQDLSVGMYTVQSAGYHAKDALEVERAAAEGARAENADLATVTNAVTSALRDYHLPASDAALVTSKLIAAVSDGKTNFQDLTGAMSAVLPVAAATHISMAEVLGDLSSMTLHGESAENSAQNLANAIRSLANPTLAATKELAALGINSADLSKNLGTTGVSGAMNEVVTAILQHMGPAGTTLLSAFNQSRQAASDAARMFAALPPPLHDLAMKMQDGQLSMHAWTQGLKTITPLQANLLNQWLLQDKRATGFSDALKSGGNASQTFTQALAKATGGSTSLNVALMLTGENAEKTRQNIADIAKATTEAGGHVQGWAAVNSTLNQRLAEIRAGIGAWIIQLGQALIPVIMGVLNGVGTFVHVLASTVDWLKQNRTWVGLVAVVLGTLVAPLVAIRIATLATQAAMMAWRVVQGMIMSVRVAVWLLNAAIAANPVMILVAAIAALAAGLVYAYFHFSAVRRILDDIGNFFRTVFLVVIHAVGDAVHWVAEHWKIFAIALGIVLAPVALVVGAFVLLFTHLHQVGDAFRWLYDHTVKPVMDAIGNVVGAGVRWIVSAWHTVTQPIVNEWNTIHSKLSAIWRELVTLWNVTGGRLVSLISGHMTEIRAVFEVVWGFIKRYLTNEWNALVGVARVVWDVISKVVELAWGLIRGTIGFFLSMIKGEILAGWALVTGVFRIAWNVIVTVVKIAWDVIRGIFEAVFAVIRGMVVNFWDIITGIFRVAWDIVCGVFNTALDIIKGILKIFIDLFTGNWSKLWQDAKGLVTTVLGDIWNVIRGVFGAIWDTIRSIGQNIWNTIVGVWNSIKQTVMSVAGDIWSGLKSGFQDAVNVIGQIWTGLEKAFGTPIEFVIRTILNNGIIKGVNYILNVVGLSIPNIPDPNLPTFKTGGVVPGSGPVDSVHAMLTPGEGVLVPLAVAALGGKAGIDAINRAYGGGSGPTGTGLGLPGFGLGGFVSGLISDIGHGLSSAWNAVKNVALGGLREAASTFFDDVIKPLVATIPGGSGNVAKQFLVGLLNKTETDLLDFLGQKDQSAAGSGTGGPIGGSIPTESRLAILTQALTADNIPPSVWPVWEAGLNTLITRESNWVSTAVNNWDSNAKKGTPSTGLGQTILPTFEAFRNKSLPDSMIDPVANVAAVINYVRSKYGDITHVQQANANMPAKGYDIGGYMPVGWSLAYNGTQRPEPVLSAPQWDAIRQATEHSGGSHAEHHYHIDTHDPLSVAHEIERRERARMRATLV